jgi:hypothetical protein
MKAILSAAFSALMLLQAPRPPTDVRVVDTAAPSPLFHMRDAEYLGAFRLPKFNNFDFCQCGLTFDKDGNSGKGSLFIATFNFKDANWGGVAECSIPTPAIGTSLSELNTCTILQPDTDALEQRLYLARSAGFGAASNIMGLQVNGQKLYINAAANYDANGTQSANFFVRDKNLSTTSVQGPFGTTLFYQGRMAGYMAPVPSMYQADVGGDTISGMWSASIVTRESSGPAAFSYNLADIGPIRLTPNKLIFYPSTNQLGFYNQSGGGCGHTWVPPCLENGDVQLDFNPGLSGHEGAVIASGLRTIMFFGGLGVGPYGYGTATTDPALNGKPNGLGDYSWYDPEEPSKGTHAYPYRAYYWLYRLDDALAVKNGTMKDEDAYPYEYGDISQFIPNWANFYAGKQGIKGAAWDESRRILYFSADKQDGASVLIHALHIPG